MIINLKTVNQKILELFLFSPLLLYYFLLVFADLLVVEHFEVDSEFQDFYLSYPCFIPLKNYRTFCLNLKTINQKIRVFFIEMNDQQNPHQERYLYNPYHK
jgi:hypothetical protein